MKFFNYCLLIGLSLVFTSCTEDEIEISSEKDLLTFTFLKQDNLDLGIDCIGDISNTDVYIDIPIDVNTDKLVASFSLSAGAELTVGNTLQISGVTSNNFSAPLVYTITARDKSTDTYTVQINLIGTPPNLSINETTSYYQYQLNNLYVDLFAALNTNKNYLARAYADYDKDGDIDVMAMYFNYTENVGLEVEYFKNDGISFISDQLVFENFTPTYVHGRKAICGDFDNNGWSDVVIAGHGWDQPPFPGEYAYIMLNNNGLFSSIKLPLQPGFYHSLCSGDIDNDGDIDLFFTDNFSVGKFLVNDGNGSFSIDASIFPSEVYGSYYTSELYDINNDGYLDLVNTGHEMDGAASVIFWGDYSNKYSTDRMFTLPDVAYNGVVIDIDFIDYDGDNLTDILLTRTGDNTGALTFYQGYYLQMLKNDGSNSFTDVTSLVIINNSNPNTQWIDWIRVHDINKDGKMDFTTDNKSYNLEWINVNGIMTK